MSHPATTLPVTAKRQLFLKAAAAIGMLVPVVLFYRLLLRLAVNVPFTDDFAVLEFILYRDQRSLAENLAALTAQHMEHRIAYSRMMGVLLHLIQGEVNLVAWNVAGCASVLGVCFLLYRASNLPRATKLLFFVPVVWLLQSPYYHNNMFWGMATLQNLTVVLFALLTIYLATKNRTSALVLSVVFAFVAAFTSTSGLLAPVVGLMVMAFQRRYKHLLVYGAATAALYALYFHGFNPVGSSGKSLTDYPETTFAFFFGFLGNSLKLSVTYTNLVIVVTGLLLFIYVLFLLYEQHFRKNLALFAMILFIIILAAPSAIARAGHGFLTATDSRYSIYSITLIAALYLISFEWIAPRFHKFLFGFGLLLSLFSFHRAYDLASEYGTWFKIFRLQQVEKWSRGQGVAELDSEAFRERATNTLVSLYKKGYYVAFPYGVLPTCTRSIAVRFSPSRQSDLQIAVETTTREGTCAKVSGWCRVVSLPLTYPEQKVVLVAEHNQKLRAYQAAPVERPDVQGFFAQHGQTLEMAESGFAVYIPLKLVKESSRIGILITVADKTHFRWLRPEEMPKLQ